MGLLDGFFGGKFSQDPEQDAALRAAMLATSLGMLSGKGNFGQVAGQAGMQGLGVYGRHLALNEEIKNREAQRKLDEMRMQQAQMGLEQAKRQNEMEQRRSQLLPQYFQPAQQMPVGPSMEEPGWMATAPAKQDLAGYALALANAGDTGALGMLPKPQGPIKLGKDDRLLDPTTFKPLVEPVPEQAKPKWEVVKLPDGRSTFVNVNDPSFQPGVYGQQDAPTTRQFGRGGNVLGDYIFDPDKKLPGERLPTDDRFVLGGTRQAVSNTNVNVGKEVPPQVVEKVTSLAIRRDQLSRLGQTFKPEFGGDVLESVGRAKNEVALRLGDESGRAQWWQDYQEYKNAVRHELFGSALTVTEKAEFDRSQVHPGMAPGEIRKNLARQQSAVDRAVKKMEKVYSSGQLNKEQVRAMTEPQVSGSGVIRVDAQGNRIP